MEKFGFAARVCYSDVCHKGEPLDSIGQNRAVTVKFRGSDASSTSLNFDKENTNTMLGKSQAKEADMRKCITVDNAVNVVASAVGGDVYARTA